MSLKNDDTVVHFSNIFLRPTETFIYNQLKYASSFKPIFLCRKQIKSPFDLQDIQIIQKNSCLPTRIENRIVAKCEYFGYVPYIVSKPFKLALQNISPSIIHAHFGPNGSFILKPSIQNKIPIITSFYGYDVNPIHFTKKKWLFKNSTYKKLKSAGNNFLVMSKDMKNDLLNIGFPEERILIHHHGLDVDEFYFGDRSLEIKKDKIKFLQLGRLVQKKGQINVLKALKILKEARKDKNIELTFVGSGNCLDELKKYVQENDLIKYVTFYEHINHEELLQIFKDHDIFIHPSIKTSNGEKEGIPTSILEAMSSGMPIISTYHAGIPEAISNGEEGILVQENDTESLAEAMFSLANNSQMQKSMGNKAILKVRRNYDIKNQIKNLETIYRNVIKDFNKKKQ
jgi:colanic acid/amylovoran biosynthesis glycosyltransferase